MTDLERKLDWEAESAKYPGMSRETFVTNHLSRDTQACVEFMLATPALHGRVIESTWTHHREFEEVPDKPGWVRADLSKPHVCVRVQAEIVIDGKSKIIGERRFGYGCGDD